MGIVSVWSMSIIMKTKFNFPENLNSVVFGLFKHGFLSFMSWVGLWSTKYLMKKGFTSKKNQVF